VFFGLAGVEGVLQRVEHAERVLGVDLPDRVRVGELLAGALEAFLDVGPHLRDRLAEQLVVVER
jgi:hypothetical protein